MDINLLKEQIAAGTYAPPEDDPDEGVKELAQELATVQFRQDLERCFEMTDDPRADKMWELAWEARAPDLEQVLAYYIDLYRLTKPVSE